MPGAEPISVLSAKKRLKIKPTDVVFDLFGTITKQRYLPAIMGWCINGKKPTNNFIDQDIVKIICDLSKNYRLHILSNANHEFVDASLRRVGIYDRFDQIVISSQSRARKPSKEAFAKLIERGIIPSKCLFIDDRKVNRQVAKTLGFNVLIFNNKQELIKKLYQFQKA